MKKQLQQLIRLFSTVDSDYESFSESWDSVEVVYYVNLQRIPPLELFLKQIPFVSSRDSWTFKIIDSSGDSILRRSSGDGDLKDFSEIEAYKELLISIKFSIRKVIQNNRLSIYSIYDFKEFCSAISLFSFLNALNTRLKGSLILECVNETVDKLETTSITVASQEDVVAPIGIDARPKIIRQCGSCIHWGTYRLILLPDDLCSHDNNNPLSEIFNQVSACLLMMYLFDYTTISEDALNLKLLGFKSLKYTLDTSSLSVINIDKTTKEQLYDVYVWVISGGYVADKFSIARNILSINLDTYNVKLNSQVIDAIKSNFRIYEKENVEQYIQLRNEISNLLIDLQTKVNDIVQNFTSDFKSNLLALISFFTSVIVLGVVSGESPFAYFTNHIIFISLCFLFISLCYWLYSYKELERKTRLFTKHYSQIKERYSAILDEVELNNVFEESDPNQYESHASYVEWQKNRFSTLWIGSLAILAIALIILLFFNNLQSLEFLKILISILYVL